MITLAWIALFAAIAAVIASVIGYWIDSERDVSPGEVPIHGNDWDDDTLTSVERVSEVMGDDAIKKLGGGV